MSGRKNNTLQQKDLNFFFSGKRRLDRDDNSKESMEIHRDFVLFVSQIQFIVVISIAGHVDTNAIQERATKRNDSHKNRHDQLDENGNENKYILGSIFWLFI